MEHTCSGFYDLSCEACEMQRQETAFNACQDDYGFEPVGARILPKDMDFDEIADCGIPRFPLD